MKLPKILRVIKPIVAHELEMILLFYYGNTAKWRRPKHTTGNILLARTDGLGDFVIWLSCAEKFRAMYPDKTIYLMLDSIKPTLELAEKMPHLFDRVFNIDIHNYTRFFCVSKMKRLEFDIVIQPAYSRVPFTDVLLFACKAGKRITLDTNAKFMTNPQLKWSNRGFDEILPASVGVKHELIRCGELMRGLGVSDFKAGMPSLYAAQETKRQAFISFPAASGPTKMWEPEKYAEVLDEIIERTDWECMMGGGEADIPLLKEICRLMRFGNKVKIIAGKYGLYDTVRIINQSKLAIGNDTGAMHMAVASKVPSIVLMGDNEIGRFFPYTTEIGEIPQLWIVDADLACKGCNSMKDIPCKFPFGKRGTYHCIESITVERCLEAVNQALKMVN